MADKGLKSNVVGLFGGTMLGISSVALACGPNGHTRHPRRQRRPWADLDRPSLPGYPACSPAGVLRGETIIHESAHAHMAKHEHLLK
jgi:hypothetical protein